MRIALFGGTFDPIHWGHLLLAESARTAFDLQRVIFVPTGVPPHKLPAVATPDQRLRMVKLAIASNPYFQVSDWEVRQRRVVYSFETVDHFKRGHSRDSLYFITGSDMLQILPKWRKGSELIKQVTFLAAERPGYPWRRLPAAVRRKAKQIPWPAVPLASSEIRQRARQGKSIRYQVPDAVERYIRAHRLYVRKATA